MPETIQAKILRAADLVKCSGQTVALDTETTGLDWNKNELIGLGVWCPDIGIYGYIPTLSQSERDTLKQACRDLEPGTTVIAHNAKFDFHFLGANPRKLGWNVVDTTVPVHLLDSRNKKAAVDVERMLFGIDTKKELIERQPRNKRNKIWEWPTRDVALYCINDVRIEYEMARVLLPWIDSEGLWDLFLKEMEYLKVIWEIERVGMLLDTKFVSTAKKNLGRILAELETQLYDSVGYEFNWRSHQQLSQALYQDMGIPVPENPFKVSRFNRDKGKYNSTNTSTFILMEKAHHPLGELVSTLRETSKLVNYLDTWLKLVGKDGALHTNFNMTGTRTGRLSSSKPNLQNIPSEVRNRFTQAMFSGEIERADEYNLRNGLISRPGMSYVAVDYKQMEMRMFGVLSGDPFMLESLNEGRDVHGDMAEQIWGERDRTRREWAKTVSFGLIYGMTTGSLQFKLELSREEAERVTNQYWSTFPRIRPWLYGTADECKEKGYVEYWSGRRWVEDQSESYFKSANALIQGGCADLLSIAALRVADWLEETGHGYLVSLVHDELIAEVPDELVDEVAVGMGKIMLLEDIFDGVLWYSDAKVGKAYGHLTKVYSTIGEPELA